MTTGFGALLVISWPVALLALAIFLLVVTSTRYVSLSSMAAVLTMLVGIITSIALGREPFASLIFAMLVASIVIFRHLGNMQRLLAGTEPKIGERTTL